MIRCARCEFTAPPGGSLADHARDADHGLCIVCTRSLRADEKQTCERCLTGSRSVLAEIVDMWSQLHRQLGQIRGASYDGDRAVEDGRPLLGGDALVLAGPGAAGNRSRFGDDYEPDPVLSPERWWTLGGTGPLTREAYNASERVRYGKEHLVDNRATDAPSVAWVLSQWEQDWRDWRTEPLPSLIRPPVARQTRDAAAYLEVHARWAANQHPAFDSYVEDLHGLRARLARVTGRDDPTRAAEAECFSCGGKLVRLARTGTPCGHDLASLPPYPPSEVLVLNAAGRPRTVHVPVGELRAAHEQAIAVWEAEHGRCQQQGGYADTWTCLRCGSDYSWERYTLALRARLSDSPASGWSLPQHVAWLLDVPVQTVLTWAKRGVVGTACLVADRRLRVSYDDTRRRAEDGRRRAEAREERDRATRRTDRAS